MRDVGGRDANANGTSNRALMCGTRQVSLTHQAPGPPRTPDRYIPPDSTKDTQKPCVRAPHPILHALFTPTAPLSASASRPASSKPTRRHHAPDPPDREMAASLPRLLFRLLRRRVAFLRFLAPSSAASCPPWPPRPPTRSGRDKPPGVSDLCPLRASSHGVLARAEAERLDAHKPHSPHRKKYWGVQRTLWPGQRFRDRIVPKNAHDRQCVSRTLPTQRTGDARIGHQRPPSPIRVSWSSNSLAWKPQSSPLRACPAARRRRAPRRARALPIARRPAPPAACRRGHTHASD